jgi:hypothetical protein
MDDLCTVPWDQPWIEGVFTRLHGQYFVRYHTRHQGLVSTCLIQTVAAIHC